MTLDGTYKLIITPEHLTFKTFFYKAEKGSILHNALMNRETTSLIVASFISGLLFVLFAINFMIGTLEYVEFIILFGLLFLFFRMSIFKERPLEVMFLKDGVRIKYPSFIIKRVENFNMNKVKSISVVKRIFNIENPEGAEIVKKISLQHGTVIPDFTESQELYLLLLELKDETNRVIYADRRSERIKHLQEEIKKWLSLLGIPISKDLFISQI